jgi:carnitine-CoA ligase
LTGRSAFANLPSDLGIDPFKLSALVGGPTCTLDQLLRAGAERDGDAILLRTSARTWTYSESLQEAQSFANWASSTVAWTDNEPRRIVSFLPNRPEVMWVWFGSMFAGSVYVSLNYQQRGPVLLDMLRRSGARLLVTDREGLELLPELGGTSIERILLAEDTSAKASHHETPCHGWQEVDNVPGGLAQPDWEASNPAQLLFTSGTTGRSKAVVLSHTQLIRGAGWAADAVELDETDVVHTWLPLFHIGGQVDAVLATMIGGGTVALFPTFSRSRFWEEVESVGATILVGFENVLRLIESLPPRPNDQACSLRAGIVGGVPLDLRQTFEKRFGVKLHEAYGMTEVEPVAFQSRESPPGSVGRPRPDLDVAIVNPADETVAPEVLGEIVVRPRRPDIVFRGYEGDDAATLGATGNLWYHTGDLGTMDADGYLYFKDRLKHTIRRRGENISIWELESTAARHPDVLEVAVTAVRSELGEDDVKFVLVARPHTELDPGRFRDWCRRHMASFMLPRFIEVVDSVPRLPTGKVDYQTLAEGGGKMVDFESDRAGRC